MCGIAGYIATPEWTSTYINSPDIQREILKQAWHHNLHRGTDAAGFMGWTADKNLVTFKNKGSGDKLFKSKAIKQFDFEPMTTFAAHTRNQTKGSPENNGNNHPVEYGNVIAIHNGSVNNDNKIINHLITSQKDYEKLPMVDSIAIPLVLNTFDGDFYKDFNQLGALVSELEGNQAVHAFWKSNPDISLLYRRDFFSPLIVAYDESGAMLYGSEVESLMGMMRAIGIKNPGSSELFQWRKIDGNTVIMFDKGTPVKWGEISKNAKNYLIPKAPQFWTKRLLPKTKRAAYFTDSTSFWSNKVRNFPETLVGLKDTSDVTLLYDREKVDIENMFPIKNPHTSILANASEADRIYVKDKIFHIFVGEAEILVDEMGELLDVFHHKYGQENRYVRVRKEDTNKVTDYPALDKSDFEWERFFGTYGKTSAVTHREHGGSLKAHTTPTNNGSQAIPMAGGTGLNRGLTNRWKPDKYINWVDLNDLVENTKMPNNVNLALLTDVWCNEHQTLFSDHASVGFCRSMRWKVLETFASCSDLSMLPLLSSQIGVNYDFEDDDDGGQIASCIEGCDLVSTTPLTWYQDAKMLDLYTHQECSRCGFSISLLTLPKFLMTISHSASPRGIAYVDR